MNIFLNYKINLLIQQALTLFVLSIVLTSSSLASDKKGIGLSEKYADKNKIAALNVSWYYTWSINPIEGTTKEKFVPMLWGGEARRINNDLRILHERKKSPSLLVLNEPNEKQQANMSVDEAVRLWPKASILADKIGSPATVGGAMSPWFKQFFKMTHDRNLKIDFITVHKYGPPDAKKFLYNIDKIYEKYQKPIWITEFAVADWSASKRKCRFKCKNRYSENEVLSFMKQVLPELEKRPYVIRYAWFGAGNTINEEQLRTSSLFDNKGNLTEIGKYYANFH